MANATLAGQNGADIAVKTTGDLLLGTTVAPPGNVLLTGRGVTLQSAGNLTETPGSVIVADSLGGNAAIATLPGANQVATLTSFSAPGGFSMTDARNLAITGTVTALTSGPVGIVAKDGTGTPSATEAGQAGIGHLTIASTGVVTGNTVSLTGTDDRGGRPGRRMRTARHGFWRYRAADRHGYALRQYTRDCHAGHHRGQRTAWSAAKSAVTLAAPGGVSVNGGIVDAGTSSTTGTVNIGTGLALTGGKVFADTVNVVGGATMTGGLLHANHLTGAITFNSGDFYDGDPLTVALGPSVTGQIATRGTLTATGAGSVTTSANIYAGKGATLTVNGDVTQTAGQIAAGNDLTVLAKGGHQPDRWRPAGGRQPAAERGRKWQPRRLRRAARRQRHPGAGAQHAGFVQPHHRRRGGDGAGGPAERPGVPGLRADRPWHLRGHGIRGAGAVSARHPAAGWSSADARLAHRRRHGGVALRRQHGGAAGREPGGGQPVGYGRVWLHRRQLRPEHAADGTAEPGLRAPADGGHAERTWVAP